MHGAPGTPGAPGARRAAPAPRWVRAATEWMPQRLRAEPAGRSRDAGCVRMRRVKASYPQHIGRRAPKGADAPGRVAPVPLGYWEMQHYAQLCAALGRRRTRADAQKASGRAPQSRRDRSTSGSRSVVLRAEIGRKPHRDRSASGSKSVGRVRAVQTSRRTRKDRQTNMRAQTEERRRKHSYYSSMISRLNISSSPPSTDASPSSSPSISSSASTRANSAVPTTVTAKAPAANIAHFPAPFAKSIPAHLSCRGSRIASRSAIFFGIFSNEAPSIPSPRGF